MLRAAIRQGNVLRALYATQMDSRTTLQLICLVTNCWEALREAVVADIRPLFSIVKFIGMGLLTYPTL